MEYFSWRGYKYSPSSVQFFLNRKPLRLPEEMEKIHPRQKLYFGCRLRNNGR